MSKISIIVPVYNVEQYLRRCVDSILGQTFQDFEIVLVDDGSSDNSGVICDQYAGKDGRIHVIHQKNSGASAARNAGIIWANTNSDSEWIGFIDSDDWVHCEYLETLYNAVRTNDVLVSITDYERSDGLNPEVDENMLEPKICSVEKYFIENNTSAIVPWGKIYAKSCFKEIRFPVGKNCEDEFTTYKTLFMKEQIAVIGAPLYVYFINENSLSSGRWTPKRMDVIEAFEERIEYFDHLHINGMREYAVSSYIYRLQNFIKQIDKEQEHNYWRERKLLFKKLRTAIIKYRKEYPLQTHEWAYNIAFPKIMWLYWACKSHLTKK